jgi:hypothetical protein
MEENWYAVEQQIRDRLTEARAAARIETLTRKPAPRACRPNSVGITISPACGWRRNDIERKDTHHGSRADR